ncbi:MAG: FlgD immunoglobulin-like domain containing protein [Candidatus Cloacimonadaceae bacterium]|nr:FlgD immunoglobulin-like domain containing protein [Candidatus Cloacimonadaceae bacterium]
MRKLMLMFLLFALIMGLSAAVVWPNAVPIRQGVNIEWFRTGIETADGAAVYVWSDTKLGERDLWAQKVDAQGNMVWGAPLLVDGKPDRQEDPVITRTSDNNLIIAWIDFYDDLDGNVYAQKVTPSGQLLWQQGGKPVCTHVGVQIALNIEPDNAGGAYLVWVDSRSPSKDLYGQRIDSNGNPVWAVNGIPIANGIGDEVQNTMLPDGQGGMMIAYTHTYVGAEDIYLKRFLPNGSMAWPQMVVLADAPGNQGKVRMATLTNGEFVFTWQDQRNNDDDIYAQKVNLQGQLLWSNPFIVFGDSGTASFAPQINPRLQATSDNAVIIVWEDNRLDNLNADLFAQKVSSAGTLLWNALAVPICTAPFAQISQRLASDGQGGAYIVWDDLRNGNAPNDDIYAQHISSAGQALWEANGKAICTAANTQNSGLIKVANGNVFINWMDIRNGSVGIYYQVLTSAGTALLETNGREVFWGLSGDTPLDNYLILPRQNDTVIIWQDNRFANLGYQIYFQFLNSDGTVDLETNGRPVTLPTGADQITPQAAVTPDGHIAIIWEDKRNPNPKIYMQLISPQGNRLWGDFGIELTVDEPIRQKDPMITYMPESNIFFVGWSNYDQIGGSFLYHVYGQAINATTYTKLWGVDGKILSATTPQSLSNECILYDLKQDYYSWQRYDPIDGTLSIYVKRVNLQGNPYLGWPEDGLRASTHSNLDTNQLQPISSVTNNGIFLMWKDGRDDSIQNFWGQHVSASGARMWNPVGVNLADYGREQEQPAIVPGGNDITFAWCENINGMFDIIAQKYSLDGNPLWGNLGYFVVQKDSTQSNPSVGRFANGGVVISWTEYYSIESDIYYKYIKPDGTFVSQNIGGDIITAAGKGQYKPYTAVLGESALVIWADGRSSGKTEILGLYAQKLSNGTVSIDDQNIPAAAPFTLMQNFPNPFNPNTTIKFNIKDTNRDYQLSIYNIKGQVVRNLHSGKLASGTQSITWNGKDDSGNGVASGIYFYRLSDGSQSQSRRMLMMK